MMEYKTREENISRIKDGEEVSYSIVINQDNGDTRYRCIRGEMVASYVVQAYLSHLNLTMEEWVKKADKAFDDEHCEEATNRICNFVDANVILDRGIDRILDILKE